MKHNPKIKAYAQAHAESEFEDLNFDHFLKETQGIKLEASERLRQLAISVEDEYSFETQKCWPILDSIYKRAAEENSKDDSIYESRGISAAWLRECCEDKALNKTLFEIAEAAYAKAFKLGSQRANLFYCWGNLYYQSEHFFEADYKKAIEKFEAALKIEPLHSRSHMQLGYIYFDMKQWDKAIPAFEKVDEAKLRGHWERIKRHELIACAYIELGQKEHGLELLQSKVISEYELGRYHTIELDLNLAYPTEMIRTLKRIGMRDLVAKIEGLVE